MSRTGFTASDAERFASGHHFGLHEVLGAHPVGDGTATFRVWAPNARSVQLIGDMNDWRPAGSPPFERGPAGVWEATTAATVGERYRFRITPPEGEPLDKSDPFAFAAEVSPATASIVADPAYEWSDGAWLASRGRRFAPDAPVSIYEVHLGSWCHEPGGYRAIAPRLADHVERAGFTHVELLPITEHPFTGSWGYQPTGYFAPTSRHGSPADLKAFVDHLHQRGIGVVLDWVPSHFPDDPHGLAVFDGTHLFEHPDPRLGHHPDWDSCVFDYDRPEVRSFLLSSAHFWIEEFHIDGLRVDAVASMLSRDYSRAEGEWIPNEHGGREHLGAIALIRELNRSVAERAPDVQVVAEESAAWPGVTAPIAEGGLGFGYKWDMGWMHDTLRFLGRDPADRNDHHEDLTFRSVYWSSERYVLPLSHDEVSPGNGSLLGQMAGDRRQQFAGLRLLLGYQWTTPGKKLLFMGAELAVPEEWHHDHELPWELASEPDHSGMLATVTALNRVYRDTPALHVGDCDPDGFAWLIGDDHANSVFAFIRRADSHPAVVVAANFSARPHHGYAIRVPVAGTWRPLIETDAVEFGGTGHVNGAIETSPSNGHDGHPEIRVRLGPLALSVFAVDP